MSTDQTRPRDSATIVVVRQAPETIELFCVQRHAQSAFLGGAVVFPGGKVDPADYDDEWGVLTGPLSARALALAADAVSARAMAVAASRELLEEAAILTVSDTIPAERVLALRQLLAERQATASESRCFASLLREHQLKLATDRLEGLWRWVTPDAEPRRYDTRFYLLALPEGQEGAHDELETTHSFWASPEQILERFDAGQIFLAPPTLCTIELFRSCRSVDDARSVAARQTLEPICPHVTVDSATSEMIIAMPGDVLYPGASQSPIHPDAPTRFVLKSGRFILRR